MTDQRTQILTSFHQATVLPTYVFTAETELVASFKNPVTPTLPLNWLTKLPAQLPAQVNLFFIPNLGLIGLFNDHDHQIIVWNNNVSVQGSPNYSEQLPMTGVEQFKAQLRLLYFTLTNQIIENSIISAFTPYPTCNNRRCNF